MRLVLLVDKYVLKECITILLHILYIFRSLFSDFASKYGKEERFKGIDKMRERESIFIEYVNDLRKREKEEKSMLKEKVRIKMLLEAMQTLTSLSKR